MSDAIKKEDKSIYLGDIDPNNHKLTQLTMSMLSPIEIRRNMMFQLLIWDRIVLSDSQYLTDPRVHIMMSGFHDELLCSEYDLPDIPLSQKGFEKLIRAGLVEVACRENAGSDFSFSSLWTDMSRKDTRDVPYLPHTVEYAEYLDGLGYYARKYSLVNIGNRFKRNLQSGLEEGALILLPDHDIDRELRRMFFEKEVLFRNLLDFLKQQLKIGKITEARYNQIYTYIYSCYSVNISAETGCNISTQFKNLPLHLDSGDPTCDEMREPFLGEKLRSTWCLTPAVLDLLTFEDFIGIRQYLKPVFDNGLLLDFYKGNIERKNWGEVRDIWDHFTHYLELELKARMSRYMRGIVEEYEKISGKEHGLVQESLLNCGVDVVKNIVSYVPIAGNIIGALDMVSSVKNTFSYLTKREALISLKQQWELVDKFVNKDNSIITKYGDD